MTTAHITPRAALTAALAALLLAAPACTYHPTREEQDQRIRDQSAEATRELKQGAKDAVHDLGDVAQGVKEGLKSDHGSADAQTGDRVDINSASQARLLLLPGIGLTEARAIVNNRPYRSTRDLVKKGVLTRDQYDRIADRVAAR